MKTLNQIAPILVVVGALNWGLVGLLQVNLVSTLLGSESLLERAVYILVGAAGAWVAWQMWGGAAASTGKKRR